MADIEITVDGGTSKRLLTAGKYCDSDILITATGGGGGEPEPPDDGKTRLYITIPPNAMPDRPPAQSDITLYLQQTIRNGTTIDWGDGGEPETLTDTGFSKLTHKYSDAGDYTISLDTADGCILTLGWNTTSQCIVGSTGDTGIVYRCMLKKAIIGSRSVPVITSSVFRYCLAMAYISIQNGVTKIGGFSFEECYSLTSLTIPSSVVEIGSSSFKNCLGMKEYHFLSDSPPSLLNINAFSKIPSDCIIYVPVGSLEAYQTATNWSEFADQIREEGT